MFLRIGDSGENIKTIQEMLIKLGYKPGAIDGLFGKKTEKAVADFQESVGLYMDGIVGPDTWNSLHIAMAAHNDEQFLPQVEPDGHTEMIEWERVPADRHRDGYDRFFLRQDAAQAYMRVRKIVLEAGGIITSSGARRSLGAQVGASRSATSFHYTGRALDLHVGSGMENRGRDPYIVAPDGDRYWRVYVRAEGGEQMEINAVTYGSRNRGRIVSGKFLDLTSLFKKEGFDRIRARSSFFAGGSWLGAEWWHFQYEKGLKKGKSTFGEELLKVYSERQLQATRPWKYRNRIFGVNWF